MYKAPDYDSKRILEYPPDMWMSEIRYIEKLLSDQAQKNNFLNVLEWGSGNSSIHFPKYLKENGINFRWICIENFIPWHEKVVSMIKENNLDTYVECYLKSATEEANKDLQEQSDMSEFLNFASRLKRKFDFVLIDARKRSECLESAPSILARGGVVVLHDAQRERYHAGFKKYINGGEFVVENASPDVPEGIQKLWAGRIG